MHKSSFSNKSKISRDIFQCVVINRENHKINKKDSLIIKQENPLSEKLHYLLIVVYQSPLLYSLHANRQIVIP